MLGEVQSRAAEIAEREIHLSGVGLIFIYVPMGSLSLQEPKESTRLNETLQALIRLNIPNV